MVLKKFDIPEDYRVPTGIIVSVILHLLLFLLTDAGKNIFPQSQIVTNPVQEVEKRLEFQLVESDPAFQRNQAPDDAQLASDKNTIASDNVETPMPRTDRAYTEGISPSPELAGENADISRLLKNQPSTSEDKFNIEKFQDGLISTKEAKKEAANPSNERMSTNRVDPNQKFSSALKNLGGFSLSTYNWDFAPYMLELKRRIDEHISPPSAFTRLGLIDGRQTIKFVITKQGDLRVAEVQNYIGSKVLLETSMNAIKDSFPFKPLPDNFPEKELVVTGHFSYLIRR